MRFDPENIDVFGISFPTWWAGYLPMIHSNGGQLASDDGTELPLNQPAAVEALQAIQDLIYVHHVAPTPAQSEALPSASVMMQSGGDQRALGRSLDHSQLGFDWGIGVLPYHQEPATILLGSPTVIYAATEHPDEAFTFYKVHNDPSKVDLYAKGLWMPLRTGVLHQRVQDRRMARRHPRSLSAGSARGADRLHHEPHDAVAAGVLGEERQPDLVGGDQPGDQQAVDRRGDRPGADGPGGARWRAAHAGTLVAAGAQP